MKKIIFTCLGLSLFLSAKAQDGRGLTINQSTLTAGSIVDIAAGLPQRGIIIPNVSLDTDISKFMLAGNNPVDNEGIMVYNIGDKHPKGYYVWTNKNVKGAAGWEKLVADTEVINALNTSLTSIDELLKIIENGGHVDPLNKESLVSYNPTTKELSYLKKTSDNGVEVYKPEVISFKELIADGQSHTSLIHIVEKVGEGDKAKDKIVGVHYFDEKTITEWRVKNPGKKDSEITIADG